MQDDFVALFAYDHWANTKVFDACRKLTAEQFVAEPVPGWSSVRSTIYHIAPATEFNLRALAGDPDAPNAARQFNPPRPYNPRMDSFQTAITADGFTLLLKPSGWARQSLLLWPCALLLCFASLICVVILSGANVNGRPAVPANLLFSLPFWTLGLIFLAFARLPIRPAPDRLHRRSRQPRHRELRPPSQIPAPVRTIRRRTLPLTVRRQSARPELHGRRHQKKHRGDHHNMPVIPPHPWQKALRLRHILTYGLPTRAGLAKPHI